MRTFVWVTLLTLVMLWVSGCKPDTEPLVDLGQATQGIYYGTRDPQSIVLTEEQKLAVGWLHYRGHPSSVFCSATLVGPREVATAAHCFMGGGGLDDVAFSVGEDVNDPHASFALETVIVHPDVDAAMVLLAEDATEQGVEPIAVNRDDPSTLLDQAVEAAGFGQTHDGSTGRFFAVVYLEHVDSTFLTVNGRGEQGLCYGDSGGPLLKDGPAIMAVESHGDDTCVGIDEMTRLDLLYDDWIAPILSGEYEIEECGDLDYLGRCNGDVAEWCAMGQIQREDCGVLGMNCAYVNSRVGYYCTDHPSTDPCSDPDYEGSCDGDVLSTCVRGELQEIDCAAQDMSCQLGDDGEADCVPAVEPCTMDDELCDGEVAVRCEDGEWSEEDCAAQDTVCELDDEDRPICREPETPDTADDGAEQVDAAEPEPEVRAEDEGVAGEGSGDSSGCQTTRSAAPKPWWLLIVSAWFVFRSRRWGW